MYLLLDYRLQTTNCRMPLEQIKMEIENVCDICQLDFFSTILRDIYTLRKKEKKKERKRICNVLWFIKNVK